MVRKAFGLLLFAAGCTFAATAYQNAPSDREDNLAAVTRILTNPGVSSEQVTNGVPNARPAATPAPVKSEQKPETPTVVATVEPAVVAAADPAPKTPDLKSESSTAVAPAAPVPTAPAPKSSSASPWQAPVSGSALSSTKPGDASARYELVRSVQKELKRAGCYHGEAHGSWTGSSKRALKAFMERANASLPVDDPDYVQLSLLQSKSGVVCGNDCPKGQSFSSGRCVPRTVLAQAPAPVQPSSDAAKIVTPTVKPDPAWATTTTPSVPMAPSVAEAVPATVAPVPTVVASAEAPNPTSENEVLPWHQKTAAADPIVAPVKRKAPPVGRMSVGAPMPDIVAPAPIPAVRPKQEIAMAEATPSESAKTIESAPTATASSQTTSTSATAAADPAGAATNPAASATDPAEIKTASIEQPQEPIESFVDLQPDPSATVVGSQDADPSSNIVTEAPASVDTAAVAPEPNSEATQSEPVVSEANDGVSDPVARAERKKRKANRSASPRSVVREEFREYDLRPATSPRRSVVTRVVPKPRTRVARFYYAPSYSPKFFTPKIFSAPKFVVYRPRFTPRGTRSVQSLFQHPLGRM
jgi:hypothetical protein